MAGRRPAEVAPRRRMDDKEVYVNELTREFCSGAHRIGWVDCGYD